MRIISPTNIVQYSKALGKQFVIQTKKTTLPKLNKAICRTKIQVAGDFEGFPREYLYKNVLELTYLESIGKGTGTRAVQSVVRRSLADPSTNGRVVLLATNIYNDTPHPFKFYYKLGFRATEPMFNDIGKAGQNLDFGEMAFMYLPKENASKCLNYRTVTSAKALGLKYDPKGGN